VTAGPLAILRVVPLLQKNSAVKPYTATGFTPTLLLSTAGLGLSTRHQKSDRAGGERTIGVVYRGIVSPVLTNSPVVYRYT
jgi:hypothetical protein